MNNILKLLFYFTKQNARGSSRQQQRLCARSRATCYGIYYYFQRSWLCVDPVHTSYSITAPSRLWLLLRKKNILFFERKKEGKIGWIGARMLFFPPSTHRHTQNAYILTTSLWRCDFRRAGFTSLYLFLYSFDKRRSGFVWFLSAAETSLFLRRRLLATLCWKSDSHLLAVFLTSSPASMGVYIGEYISFVNADWTIWRMTYIVQQQLAINPRNNPITLVVKPVLLTNTTWPFLIFPSLSNIFFPVFLVDLYLN